MASQSKKDEIIVLLKDYLNFLPAGSGEAYIPAGDTSYGSNDPLTPEAEKRMDHTTLVGETYQKLDTALQVLARKFPKHYRVIEELYLEDGKGHNELVYIKHLAKSGTIYRETAQDWVKKHDQAVDILAGLLEYESLYVRWPMLHIEFDSRSKAESANEEIFAIYSRYLERGSSHDHAVANVQALLDDDISKEYIERVIDARLG